MKSIYVKYAKKLSVLYFQHLSMRAIFLVIKQIEIDLQIIYKKRTIICNNDNVARTSCDRQIVFVSIVK